MTCEKGPESKSMRYAAGERGRRTNDEFDNLNAAFDARELLVMVLAILHSIISYVCNCIVLDNVAGSSAIGY